MCSQLFDKFQHLVTSRIQFIQPIVIVYAVVTFYKFLVFIWIVWPLPYESCTSRIPLSFKIVHLRNSIIIFYKPLAYLYPQIQNPLFFSLSNVLSFLDPSVFLNSFNSVKKIKEEEKHLLKHAY